jgi:hypothetical protein
MLKTLLKEYITALFESSFTNPKSPEFESIETFATFLIDDDREEFTHEELIALNTNLHIPIGKIKKELESYGFKLAHRPIEKHTRGFTTSSNDRWFGPGAQKTHGGAGIDYSTGRATVPGRKGTV